jgi:hypothetical protein
MENRKVDGLKSSGRAPQERRFAGRRIRRGRGRDGFLPDARGPPPRAGFTLVDEATHGGRQGVCSLVEHKSGSFLERPSSGAVGSVSLGGRVNSVFLRTALFALRTLRGLAAAMDAADAPDQIASRKASTGVFLRGFQRPFFTVKPAPIGAQLSPQLAYARRAEAEPFRGFLGRRAAH